MNEKRLRKKEWKLKKCCKGCILSDTFISLSSAHLNMPTCFKMSAAKQRTATTQSHVSKKKKKNSATHCCNTKQCVQKKKNPPQLQATCFMKPGAPHLHACSAILQYRPRPCVLKPHIRHIESLFIPTRRKDRHEGI